MQSLLLQSDFADDSAEIAGPAAQQQREVPYASSLQRGQTNSVGIARGGGGDPGNLSVPVLGSSNIPAAAAVPRTPATAVGILLPPATYINTINQQLQPQPSRAVPGASSPWSMTIDARREDAGLIFNPWMGFSGTEEFYGLLEGLSEEY